MKLRGPLYFDTGPRWQAGAGSPEGTVAAPVGSMYSRTDGGADTAVYRKETGTGNTGWVPIADVYVATGAPPGTANSGDLWYDTDEPTSLVMPMSVANGGTGGTSPTMARTNLSVPYVGNSTTTAGGPTTGTYVRGDHWLDVSNVLWVCTVGGSPGTWVSASAGSELYYSEITAAVAVPANTFATAQQIISSGAQSYDGSPILIDFVSDRVDVPSVGGAQLLLLLWDGVTNLGRLMETANPTGATLMIPAVNIRRRLIPAAGSHTYRIMAWSLGGTGTIVAGTGTPGSDTHMPAALRITRA